jgi:hypothetical protein
MVMDGAQIYLRPPHLPGVRIPGGKAWVHVDARAVADALGLDTNGLGKLFAVDPAAQLRSLRAAKGLEKVGTEQVSGAETTHYRGAYTSREFIATLPAEQRAAMRDAVAKIDRLAGTSSMDRKIPVELWIDRDGVTRRMRISQSLPGGGAGEFAMDYLLRDFGTKLHTTPPAARDTWDATATVRRFLRQGLPGVTQ